MDAPTEWTYGGLLDWSSADSLRLAPVGMAVRCIVEALKERAEAANYTLPAILSGDWNPLRFASYDFFAAIQDSITALLSPVTIGDSSVNFYKHDVDITTYQRSEVPVNWTEASILSAIDASSRLELKRLNPFASEWFFQQYQILNTMRQVFARSAGTNCICAEADYKYRFGYGATQSDVNSAWALSSNPGVSRGVRTYKDYLGYWSAYINAAADAIRYRDGADSFDNIDCEVDWYYSANWPFDSFCDFGHGFTKDVYVLKNSTIHNAGGQLIQPVRFPLNEEVAPTLTDINGRGDAGYSIGGYNGSVLALLKFDGANGFKFRDW